MKDQQQQIRNLQEGLREKERQVEQQQQKLEGINRQIEQLTQRISECCQANQIRTAGEPETTGIGRLYQITPNPFRESTTIPYQLTPGYRQASILIQDMKGTVLKTFNLSGNTRGAITLHPAELSPGYYLAVLFIDGKKVDFKTLELVR